MRRSISLFAALGLVLVFAFPVLAAEGDPGQVMVMSHACTEQPVRNQADFDKIVAQANGDEVTALVLTVLACPTIILPGDTFTDGIHGPAVDFDYTVTDANGDKQTLAEAEFMAAKLCETDVNRDANGDGLISPDVCLDISHYVFSNLAVGKVTVKESKLPNGWKFGTMLLTPQSVQAAGSNDALTGATFKASTSTATLDLSGDPDNDAMLHIYDFEKSPATDTVAAPATDRTPVLAAVLGVFALFGGALLLRRRSA